MAGQRVSTQRLGKLLHQWGFVERAFTVRDLRKGTAPKGVSDETYGRDSRIYVTTGTPERRRALESRLRREGLTFDADYWPGSSTVEIGVSYFRGWHWDE